MAHLQQGRGQTRAISPEEEDLLQHAFEDWLLQHNDFHESLATSYKGCSIPVPSPCAARGADAALAWLRHWQSKIHNHDYKNQPRDNASAATQEEELSMLYWQTLDTYVEQPRKQANAEGGSSVSRSYSVRHFKQNSSKSATVRQQSERSTKASPRYGKQARVSPYSEEMGPSDMGSRVQTLPSSSHNESHANQKIDSVDLPSRKTSCVSKTKDLHVIGQQAKINFDFLEELGLLKDAQQREKNIKSAAHLQCSIKPATSRRAELNHAVVYKKESVVTSFRDTVREENALTERKTVSPPRVNRHQALMTFSDETASMSNPASNISTHGRMVKMTSMPSRKRLTREASDDGETQAGQSFLSNGGASRLSFYADPDLFSIGTDGSSTLASSWSKSRVLRHEKHRMPQRDSTYNNEERSFKKREWTDFGAQHLLLSPKAGFATSVLPMPDNIYARTKSSNSLFKHRGEKKKVVNAALNGSSAPHVPSSPHVWQRRLYGSSLGGGGTLPPVSEVARNRGNVKFSEDHPVESSNMVHNTSRSFVHEAGKTEQDPRGVWSNITKQKSQPFSIVQGGIEHGKQQIEAVKQINVDSIKSKAQLMHESGVQRQFPAGEKSQKEIPQLRRKLFQPARAKFEQPVALSGTFQRDPLRYCNKKESRALSHTTPVRSIGERGVENDSNTNTWHCPVLAVIDDDSMFDFSVTSTISSGLTSYKTQASKSRNKMSARSIVQDMVALSVAACVIQNASRCMLARHEAIDRMCAIYTIQAHWRKILYRKRYLKMHDAASRIRNRFLIWEAKLWLDANRFCATEVQRIVRGYMANRRVNRLIYSLVRIQAVWRSWTVKNRIKNTLEAVCLTLGVDQASVERIFGPQQLATVHKMLALITVQAYVRRFLAECQCQKLRRALAVRSQGAAVRIQALFRGWWVRVWFHIDNYCALEIQRAVRGYLARMEMSKMRSHRCTTAATKVQSLWRWRVAVDEALLRSFSVVQIQALCRGHRNRKHFAIEAVFFLRCVVTVQALERRRVAMKAGFARFHCALTIQQGCRDYLQMRSKAKEFVACVCIQRQWRGLSCRTCYDSFVYDIITVQAHFRGFLARQDVEQTFLDTRESETLSQQTPFIDHEDFIHFAAALIQAEWRRYNSRVEYFYSIAVAIVIQSVARGWLTRSTIKKYLAMLKKIEMSPGQWTSASDQSVHRNR